MSVVLSTAPLSASERADSWQDAVSRALVPLDVVLHEDASAAGTIVSRQVGFMRVTTVTAGPQTVTRSPRTIAKGGKETLALTLLHRGIAERSQDGRNAVVHPGQFSLSDSRRPFSESLRQAFSLTSFQFPRSALGVTDLELQAVTATSFGEDEALSALLAGHLKRLDRSAGSVPAAQADRLATVTCDLLACLIQERQGRMTPQEPAAVQAMLLRVKEYILRHLADPGLSLAAIASAHHMSLRYLHKLFESEGVTAARWIQQQRLECCRKELARPTSHAPTVAMVAQSWGFANSSHFSRVFRHAYGISPREYQAAARGRLG
ncbi:helix-turn-helix domain-containing protein [Actinacidiphila rubida]|uniref:AraC-type DNA-binding protein n=1 Tax=Actinacidiphila rubida TaxID=310780 RepID=A0A1H8K9A4_9ACTN|nr:helix-turn-helix domain-containing protein [Actinacidiphila rubida]SEN88998.1 AraC-type DNA-binding protein [Actinacidiphila rubida]